MTTYNTPQEPDPIARIEQRLTRIEKKIDHTLVHAVSADAFLRSWSGDIDSGARWFVEAVSAIDPKIRERVAASVRGQASLLVLESLRGLGEVLGESERSRLEELVGFAAQDENTAFQRAADLLDRSLGLPPDNPEEDVRGLGGEDDGEEGER